VQVRYVAQMHVQRQGNYKHYFSPPQLLWVAARATWALMLAGLEPNVDALHICKAQPMNGLAGWLAARARRKRLYVDCDDLEVASNNFTGQWQRAVVGWWENHLPLSARGVTVNTRFQQARCEQLGVPTEHIGLVPNGFDPDRFQPVSPAETEALRRRLGLEGHPVVLFLGSLSLANHPVRLLLDAFVEVQRQLPAARLWLVGGGEDYDRITEAIRERQLGASVVQSGRIDPREAPLYYAASDVSVDPVEEDDTARSRCPLKIPESLACGVPVVTGDIGDRDLMLGQGAAGVLVQPGQASALADGLLAVLSDPARRAALSAGAREVSQLFRWDKLAADFARIYEL